MREIIKSFIYKYPEMNELGYTVKQVDFEQIDSRINSIIPDWYKEIIEEYPIIGLEIGIPYDFGQEELKGLPFKELPLLSISFNDLETIQDETLECFPGSELISEGYLCIAKDEYSTGEGIYININEEDPKV
ncbi:hypothetical protein, partial [Xanthovirga aplysinae]|uniref:hypothetical protein n=1 Tax=Xanthovirga aplysinae TaxID=2529853 RepID=UPI00165720AC